MSLFDKLKKVAKNNPYASVLSESKVFDVDFVAKMGVPAINIALSGDINGGLKSGITQLVGDSRTFKTCFGLLMMAAYMNQNEDSYAILFDSEKGSSRQYFQTFGIDETRVLHVPIAYVEDLKIQINQFLNEMKRGDKVFMFVDSVGLLPSKKEVVDAVDGKDTTDMTRAKAVNSLFRTITMQIALLDIPLVVINHYYDTQEMYSQKVVKGGKGIFLASNEIWVISRSRLKDGKETAGWSFNINILKSRTVKENSVIPVEVYYDGGIAKYSGLLEIARTTGHVVSEKMGWYKRPSVEDDKNWRKAEMDDDFWAPVLADKSFAEAVTELYCLGKGGGFEGLIDPDTGEVLSD